MRTVEQIKTEQKELLNTLREGGNYEAYKEKMKAIDVELTTAKRTELLHLFNLKYSKIRAVALQVWEVGEIKEDIICNDGSLHKVKAKKYPKLSAIPYVRCQFKDGLITRISAGGEDFDIYSQQIEYNKPTVYTRPETFTDFLELNYLPVEDMTLEQYEQFCAKLSEANEKLEEAMKQYEQARKALKVTRMQHWGFVEQSNCHLYKYTSK